jgi:2-polyprenyl-3-methyl-5-hydroxy-6-metoxy-1,4-benzoquinol methylase
MSSQTTGLALSTERAHAGMRDRIYGESVNVSLLRLFSPGPRVLDIGCGTGAWGTELRSRGARELWGVEIASEAATAAAAIYDRVLTKPSEELGTGDLQGRFDTIIAADVIEHLVDPFEELYRWREWCAPGGELVISTPNLRYFRVLWCLVARGRFDYVDGGGVMDRTHLRWFTEASLTAALLTAGWKVARRGRLASGKSGRLNSLTGGRLNGYLAPQIQLVAVNAAADPKAWR